MKTSGGSDYSPFAFVSFFLVSCFFSVSFSATDTLTPGESVVGWQTITSAGSEFTMGFFTTGQSENRYIGIWFNKLQTQTPTVVWIANRDRPLLAAGGVRPLPATGGVLTLREDGNLVLEDGAKNSVWESKTSIVTTHLVVCLLDSGNLVMRDGNRTVWQSFDHPSDTLLPDMKIGLNPRTNLSLTSWKSRDNPGPGKFRFGVDPLKLNQLFIWWNSKPVWQSGIWNGENFQQIQGPSESNLFHFKKFANDTFTKHKMGEDKEAEVYFMYSTLYKYSRLVMDYSGHAQFLVWNQKAVTWTMVWSSSGSNEDQSVAACGPNSLNNITQVCQCLPGFEPMFSTNWNSGNWTDGCKRKVELQCGSEDKFLLMSRISVPYNYTQASEDFSYKTNQNVSSIKTEHGYYIRDLNAEKCKEACLNNCNCSSYAFIGDTDRTYSSCYILEGDLINLGDEGGDRRFDLNLRLAASELSVGDSRYNRDSDKTAFVLMVILPIAGIAFLGTLIYYLWKMNVKRKGNRERVLRMPLSHFNSNVQSAQDFLDIIKFGEQGQEGLDVPFIHFETIVAATENFSESNKLGQGGFGPVYKGKLPGGREIAVKRLSRGSMQGLEEFKNEVILIAKLQHRNLVRLLGYCVEGDEKMLLYEYLVNKSLDSFLFDRSRCKVLDWEKRFMIILGVARGLLYLHQDSRLRIIHRDLKTSNILLDEEMNPKISDFGMARIFCGNQTEASTNRVVGTYGYMSPEYAVDGLFSIKSDVFSFGVVLLEIISGKKNTGFYKPEGPLSLLGHAWQLWKEDKGLELIDPSLGHTCNESEVLKYICVGLLCVQEDAIDRPTMASVVAMLVSEASTLPMPKQPAFVGKSLTSSISSSSGLNTCSHNEITVSTIGGR